MEKLIRAVEKAEKQYGMLLCYVVLIPFLYPRGFNETSRVYKEVFDCLLFLSLGVIFLWVLFDLVHRGLNYKLCAYGVVTYYVLFILITLITQKGINEGLQKLFAAPALYLFCFMQLKNNSKRLLETLANILLAVLALNITLFCPPVMDKLINLHHINFLGHVQMNVQYGLLGVFVAYLLFKLHPNFQIRAILLLGAALVSILWSDTSVGYIVLLVLAIGVAVMNFHKSNRFIGLQKLFLLDPRVLLTGYLLLGVLTMLYSLSGLDLALKSNFLALNGRTIIWREGLRLLMERPLFGYGAFGVLISTFWSEGGMNYAHSELLQHLLDGGIVLFVAFYGMLYTLLSSIRRVKNKQIMSFANLCLIAVFVVMLLESTTEYFYVSVFFCLLAYLPEIKKHPKHLQVPRKIRLIFSLNQLKYEFAKLYYPMRVRRKAKACGSPLYVGGKSYVTSNTVLGNNVNFNGMAIHGEGNVTIGNNFHSGVNCQIITSFHNYDHGNAIPYDETFIHKDVVIGDNVWLGNNVIILGGVTIGEGAIIQAGSVVCKSVPPLALAGGHPAVAFRYRDREHYERLKAERKFH